MRRIFVLALALVCASSSGAAMRQVPFDDLVSDSGDIVVAKVVGKTSHWTEDRSTIVTDVELEISSVLKGSLRGGERVTVRTEGGEVSELGMWVEHQPVFTPDETVVVVLRPASGQFRQVQHLEQGKFTVVGDRAFDFRGQARPVPQLKSQIQALVGSVER